MMVTTESKSNFLTRTKQAAWDVYSYVFDKGAKAEVLEEQYPPLKFFGTVNSKVCRIVSGVESKVHNFAEAHLPAKAFQTLDSAYSTSTQFVYNTQSDFKNIIHQAVVSTVAAESEVSESKFSGFVSKFASANSSQTRLAYMDLLLVVGFGMFGHAIGGSGLITNSLTTLAGIVSGVKLSNVLKAVKAEENPSLNKLHLPESYSKLVALCSIGMVNMCIGDNTWPKIAFSAAALALTFADAHSKYDNSSQLYPAM